MVKSIMVYLVYLPKRITICSGMGQTLGTVTKREKVGCVKEKRERRL